MAISTITLAGYSVTLVSLPATPGPRVMRIDMMDSVAVVTSPYSLQTQTQAWPGADRWGGMITLPSLTMKQEADWSSFLMEMRGQSNAFQIGKPLRSSPCGNAIGEVPLVDGTLDGNAVGDIVLDTKGWKASTFGLLLRGDMIQVGYRLYQVLENVNSDSSGKCQIPIWPSLRETPADGTAIILNNPRGLFRLASNKRTATTDYRHTTAISFEIVEFRGMGG